MQSTTALSSVSSALFVQPVAQSSTKTSPTVFLVEDDPGVRDALSSMLRTRNLNVEAFESPQQMLESGDLSRPGCLVLDLRLPEISGLELRRRLRELGACQPFILITGHGSVSAAVDAMRQALDVLEKPFSFQKLLERILEALAEDARVREAQGERESIQKRLDALTPREREIMDMFIAGTLGKNIAAALNISSKTVDVHRSHILKKMGVDTVAQLVALLK